jgi:hypothetical protein
MLQDARGSFGEAGRERESFGEKEKGIERERERETESFIIVGISITGSRASSAHGLRITILLVCSTG